MYRLRIKQLTGHPQLMSRPSASAWHCVLLYRKSQDGEYYTHAIDNVMYCNISSLLSAQVGSRNSLIF